MPFFDDAVLIWPMRGIVRASCIISDSYLIYYGFTDESNLRDWGP